MPNYSWVKCHCFLGQDLFCQTYVLLSPFKAGIAGRRFCPQLMVGSRSLCQVQRKATKGKPALPTPVRHTEGAKCCFERFIIETIMWYCQWHKYAFETNLGGQKSIWNCIQSFFFIFLSLGFGSSSFFFSPSFAAGSSFSFGFFLNMNSEIKGWQQLC